MARSTSYNPDAKYAYEGIEMIDTQVRKGMIVCTSVIFFGIMLGVNTEY
jgi:hypothetical protein